MKSSLQLWLAVIGVALIAALVLHALWIGRRRAAVPAEAAGTAFAPTRAAGDLPEAGLGREPTFGDLAGTGPGEGREAAAGTDEAAPPSSSPPAARADGPAPEANAAQRSEPVLDLPPRRPAYIARIDALIDGIVALTLEGRVSGETLLAHLPPSRRAGGKPFLIEARRQDSGEWEAPAPNRWYGELQAGVQLANRLGPINEIEYSEFVQKIQAFAEAVGALPDFPDMLDVVARGRELDGFASGHDAQLVLRLRSRRGPWPIAWVIQHAARHGFVPGATAGRLVLPSSEEGAPPMLALQFDAQAALADQPRDAQVEEIVLSFDVPQTAAADQPYNAWCAAGRALAISLDAEVADDQGHPLSPDAFPAIGEDLAQLYAALAQRDLAAGTLAARRLFS